MSILSSLCPEDVILEPFPHAVVENALSPDLIAALSREFPPLNSFTLGRPYSSSFKLERSAVETLRDPAISDSWKSFLSEQITTNFSNDLFRLFEQQVRSEYPDFESRFGKISDLSVGTRGEPADCNCAVQLDAQLVVQTPVRDEPSYDRGPHLKLRDKLFAAMLYFRPDEDESLGADWEAYSVRPGVEPVFNHQHVTDHKFLKLSRAVPYRRNTLIVYLNTPRSIQGWSLRTVSDLPMMFLNVIAQMPSELFDVKREPGAMPARKQHGLRSMIQEPIRWLLGS